jgi:protein-tyrosine-phosphatase/DNA-binding transcriptional ArsR family regulator
VVAKSVGTSSTRFLQLIADPQRWVLLRELTLSDRRVGELTALVGKPQNLVSYHLGELRSGGLISARRSSADGRDTYYRIDLARCREMFVEAGMALHPGVRLGHQPPTPATTFRAGKPRVLFLCTGNSARSQIAEAVLDHRSAHTIGARSAGSHPKPLHSYAVRVMAERGIDIAERSTKHYSRFARSRFSRIVTLCDKVKEVCPDLPGHPTTAHWSIADPSAEPEDNYPSFVRTADEIEERVEFLIAQIRAETSQTREE